ncbi:MAG: hypothetical protein QW818_03975 [Candidatus Aenigmatarchaeota archaeon]
MAYFWKFFYLFITIIARQRKVKTNGIFSHGFVSRSIANVLLTQ